MRPIAAQCNPYSICAVVREHNFLVSCNPHDTSPNTYLASPATAISVNSIKHLLTLSQPGSCSEKKNMWNSIGNKLIFVNSYTHHKCLFNHFTVITIYNFISFVFLFLLFLQFFGFPHTLVNLNGNYDFGKFSWINSIECSTEMHSVQRNTTQHLRCLVITYRLFFFPSLNTVILYYLLNEITMTRYIERQFITLL